MLYDFNSFNAPWVQGDNAPSPPLLMTVTFCHLKRLVAILTCTPKPFAIATMYPAGGRRLDKAKASQRIDPLVAAVMAVCQVSEGEEAEMPEDLSYLIA
jgi:hypothetical protein